MNIREYYDEQRMSVSSEDMTVRVMKAAQEKPKRRAFRKPAVIAAAAAVLLVGGVTAGAATGLINFNEIFIGISVEDESFGESLVGCAENVKTTVSDDDYVITLKGVTGSPAALLANIEMARADGRSLNDLQEAYINVTDITYENAGGFSGSEYYCDMNEQGVLCIDFEHRLGYDELLDGELLVDGTVSLSGSVDVEDCGKINTIEWTVEFDYTPSAESLRVSRAENTDENCILNCEREITDDEYLPLEFDVSDIVLTNTFGVVRGTILNEEFMMPGLRDINDISLVKNDGSEIKVNLASVNGDSDDSSFNFILRYSDDGCYQDALAVDLSEIEALSINDTVYELS